MTEKQSAEYIKIRQAELQSALLEQWALRGQAAKQVEEADQKIIQISHRMDELNRAVQAEEKKKEDKTQ